MWFLGAKLPAQSAGAGGGSDSLFVHQRMFESTWVGDAGSSPELAEFILKLEIQCIIGPEWVIWRDLITRSY